MKKKGVKNTSSNSKVVIKILIQINKLFRSEFFKRCLEVGILLAALASFVANGAVAILQYKANKIYRQSVTISQKANEIAKQNLMDSHAPWVEIEPLALTTEGNDTIILTIKMTNTSDFPAIGFYTESMMNMGSLGAVGQQKGTLSLMPHISMTQQMKILFMENNSDAGMVSLQNGQRQIKIFCLYRDVYQRCFLFSERIGYKNNQFVFFDPKIFMDYAKDENSLKSIGDAEENTPSLPY